MKLIDADSLIEHAEVNCESVEFVEKLIDYVAEQEEISISQGHEDDLISRRKAIDALCEDLCGGRHGCKFYPECENLKPIRQLPSAQPETERTMEEFMFGQDMGNPEDGSL